MKFFIELLISLSFSGTIPFIMYYMLRNWIGNRYGIFFQYKILKICLFYYIFPFPLLVGHFIPSDPSELINKYIYLENTVLRTTTGYKINLSSKIQKSFLVVWISILLLIVLYQFIRYLFFRRFILCNLNPATHYQTEFEIQKKVLSLHQNVSVYYCNAPISPFTYGVFHPCIVMTSIVPKKSIPMVLRHELQHIKSCDFFTRIITFIIVLLHCFNPFIYLLWKELCEMQELACDEKITENLTTKEIQDYGHSLIDICTSGAPVFPFMILLTKNKKGLLYRRISHLGRQHKKHKLLMIIGVYITCFVFFSIPAVASCEFIEIPDIRITGISSQDTFESDWLYIDTDHISPVFPADEINFKYSNQYLILEDGNIIIQNSFSDQVNATCNHTWTSATLKQHTPDGNGGCYVNTYNIVYCSKCGTNKTKTPISEFHYYVCPH